MAQRLNGAMKDQEKRRKGVREMLFRISTGLIFFGCFDFAGLIRQLMNEPDEAKVTIIKQS
jgi:hypothetical protein